MAIVLDVGMHLDAVASIGSAVALLTFMAMATTTIAFATSAVATLVHERVTTIVVGVISLGSVGIHRWWKRFQAWAGSGHPG